MLPPGLCQLKINRCIRPILRVTLLKSSKYIRSFTASAQKLHVVIKIVCDSDSLPFVYFNSFHSIYIQSLSKNTSTYLAENQNERASMDLVIKVGVCIETAKCAEKQQNDLLMSVSDSADYKVSFVNQNALLSQKYG